MNSFEVDQFLDNEEVSATITYVFSGAIDYTYVFEFVYGEPDPDQVVIVNEIVTVVDEPVVEPEEEETESEDNVQDKQRKKQSARIAWLSVLARQLIPGNVSPFDTRDQSETNP